MYKIHDYYFKRAKEQGFLARAVYKLEEIQKRYRILRRGQRVLDLGAAPGSWLQFTERIIGPKGFLVGVDLQPINHPFPEHVTTVQGDVCDPAFVEDLRANYAPFDVVLSDMSPKVSGIKVADAARSALLAEQALLIARETLVAQGHFLTKILQGPDFHKFLVEVKRLFSWVKVVKPTASRKQSREVYILAMRFKGH